jgi:hypothetical protein
MDPASEMVSDFFCKKVTKKVDTCSYFYYFYIINLKERDMKRVKLAVAAVVVIATAAALVYMDYTIYKAKFPNTTVLMYVLDGNK